MRLRRGEDFDAMLAEAALRSAGAGYETIQTPGPPQVELDEGPPLAGLIAILDHAQDLGGPLKPVGFERYRNAEVLNTLLTEVLAPAVLVLQSPPDSPRAVGAAKALERRLDMLRARYDQAAFLVGPHPRTADLYLASVCRELCASGFRSSRLVELGLLSRPALRRVSDALDDALLQGLHAGP